MEYPETKSSKRRTGKVLLAYRIIILLFSAMMYISRQGTGPGFSFDWVVVAVYGVFNTIVLLFYIPVISNSARFVFCLADILTACLAAFLSGGVDSPLIFCILIPLFSLHFVYGIKGLIYGILFVSLGIMGLLLAAGGIFIPDLSFSIAVSKLLYVALSFVLLYVVPILTIKRYYSNNFRINGLEHELKELDDINSKLIVLCEMTGSLSFESGVSHNLDKILTAFSELFGAERASIFVNHKGEVHIYGNPTQDEKAEIYKIISEHITGSEERNDCLTNIEGVTMIPIIRGATLRGVLSLYKRNPGRLTEREAVLLSVAANIISTYLENLDYIESLMFQPETSIQINKLDSGKAVKGIVDKRIFSSS